MTVLLPDHFDLSSTETVDVLVIGAGPAGLSAAAELKRLGVASVTVIDRDTVPGGMPRWCGHSPFGMREFRRVLSGPSYGDRLARTATELGATLRLRHSALAIGADGGVICATPEGIRKIDAKRVIVATGIREESRAARLIAGERPPAGIMNTGALQYFVYRERQKLPFARPVVVGTELVSMSAILTLRSAGIRPAAIIERTDRPVVRAPFGWLPRALGLPVHYENEIEAIEGHPAVTGVLIRGPRGQQRVACDGVVLTGRFTPESSLARMSDIAIDPGTGGPQIDSDGRTSHPRVFAVGNVLRGVETAGWCWSEGQAVARAVARDLAQPSQARGIAVAAGMNIRQVVPQVVIPGGAAHEALQVRLSRPVKGRLVVEAEGRPIWSRVLDSRPERRILVPIRDIAWPTGADHVKIRAEGSTD